MKDKINIAELLKDCPKGMELDCTIFEGVVFHDVVDRHYPIRVRRKQGGLINLNAYGCMDDKIDSKCVIFPKGKTTWEGFQRPFKAGDIIQDIDSYKVKITEINIDDECYGYESIIAKGIGSIPFNEQETIEEFTIRLAPEQLGGEQVITHIPKL